jgi:basic membrane protein A
MFKRVALSLIILLSFTLASCATQPATVPTTPTQAEQAPAQSTQAEQAPAQPVQTEPPAKTYRVAMIAAQGGLGDRSYNDSGYEGLKRAESELGVEVKVIESADPVGEGEQLLRNAAESGFDLVITLEYSHFDPLARVAPDYPNTTFAIINIAVEGSNVVSVIFKEHEASFLVGALAAMVTTMEGNELVNSEAIIGAIGGTQSPGIDKFIVGYTEGAQYINPEVKVLSAYSNSFGDPAKGRELALAMYDQGADIVFQIAGGTGEGVFQAAEEAKHYAIGVDSDQDYIKPGYILTSMIKRVDNAVFDLCSRLVNGSLQGGTVIEYGLKEEGVGLSPMTYTKDKLPAEFLNTIEDLRQKIISGEIQVTDITKK